MKWLAVASLTLAIISGCEPFTASKHEYEAYRRVRVANSVEGRLQASESYLRHHPSGTHRQEVEQWFEDAEPRYFTAQRDSQSGLVRYLDLMPSGPHAAAATERLRELALAAAYERRRNADIAEQGSDLMEKLSDAERLRKQVVSDLGAWVSRLAALPRWRVRTHELPHEFIYEYRMSEPEAHCGVDRCLKPLSLAYAIPDGGRLRARRALLDVVLELKDGAVVSARLSGPELFSRVAEAEELRPVRPDDALRRAEAIATVVTIVGAALEEDLPERDCGSPAVAPIVLARRCRGLDVSVIAAASAEQDDEIRFVSEP
ncbi:MAG: hypothetical protein R3B13_24090 [Polyangiaceae bacterium]